MMWLTRLGRRRRSHAATEGTDYQPLLDRLIEHHRELFKIEDERIRAVAVQAATVATVALAGIAIVAPAFADVIDDKRVDVAAVVLCGTAVLFAILTFISSIMARLDYAWRPARSKEPPEPASSRNARSRDIPSILVRRAEPAEVRP
jgi:hypothetical protein